MSPASDLEAKATMPMTIYPYLLYSNVWVFDDERTGLKEEAFVSGMSEMISRMIVAKGIPNAAQGFMMQFSDQPFDHDVELTWLRGDVPGAWMVGNWYSGNVAGELMEGWLCPALEFYFDVAPQRLFVRADELLENVDPIWRVSPEDPRQHRFMGPG